MADGGRAQRRLGTLDLNRISARRHVADATDREEAAWPVPPARTDHPEAEQVDDAAQGWRAGCCSGERRRASASSR